MKTTNCSVPILFLSNAQGDQQSWYEFHCRKALESLCHLADQSTQYGTSDEAEATDLTDQFFFYLQNALWHTLSLYSRTTGRTSSLRTDAEVLLETGYDGYLRIMGLDSREVKEDISPM